jgi:hypothetical protein
MTALTAHMIDGSTITARIGDDGTWEYDSSFVLQTDGFYFPGMTINQNTPTASVAMEGASVVFRMGASSNPVPPVSYDFQWFTIDTFSREGKECFIEDSQTVTHCRVIVSADLEMTAPVNQVPLPGWSIGVTMALIIGVGIGVMRKR